MNGGVVPATYAGPSSHDEADAAERITDLVVALHGSAKSVAEVGARNAIWQAAFRAAGVETYAGIGPSARAAPPGWPKDVDFLADVERSRFDVAHGLVEARCLTPASAVGLAEKFTKLSDMVVIGRAPCADHGDVLSPVWPSFWAPMFGARGYRFYDVLRPHLWDAHGIGWNWAQNTLVFVREDTCLARHIETQLHETPAAIDLVHPGALEEIRVYLAAASVESAETPVPLEKSGLGVGSLDMVLPRRFKDYGYVDRLLADQDHWAKVALRNPTKIRYWLDLQRIQRRRRRILR